MPWYSAPARFAAATYRRSSSENRCQPIAGEHVLPARPGPGTAERRLARAGCHPETGKAETVASPGADNSDVIVRFRNQTRTTALPEEPIPLRIYRTSEDSAAPAESAFHRLLDAADHSRTIGRSAGREWFLTHTKFLDEIARTLSLDIDRVNEGEFDDN